MRRTRDHDRGRRGAPLLAVLLAGFLGCADDERPLSRDPAAASTAPSVLADGSWSVARHLPDRSILVRADGAFDSVMVRHADGSLDRLPARVVDLALPGVPAERARALRVGVVAIDGNPVEFPVPSSAPRLMHSPDDEALVFEEANALWTLGPGTAVRRLTAQRTGSFDFDSLAARQREGEVILYWAAAPVWSPDARFIAYATNREAVAVGSGGQSIWLLDFAGGAERPLLAEAGRSYRPIGWLGAELLFIGDEPGVHAIDPVSGARRRVSDGSAVDVTRDGAALAVAVGAPDSFDIRVIESDGDTIVVPAPPDGFGYLAQGAFSPGGERLLLEAAADGGTVRRFFVLDRSTGVVAVAALPPGAPGSPRPEWLGDEDLLVAVDEQDGPTRTYVVSVAPAR